MTSVTWFIALLSLNIIKELHCCILKPVDAADEAFWSQFWSESVGSVQDVFTLIPAAEIRALREELPSNLATLCYKAVEKLVQAADSGCRGLQEQHAGYFAPVLLIHR